MLSCGLANGGGWRKAPEYCDACFQCPPVGRWQASPQQVWVKGPPNAVVVVKAASGGGVTDVAAALTATTSKPL